MRFSKEQRQEIIREFAVRHNGHFNPRLFVNEVKARGGEHPAYGWFQWDKDKAAHEFWIWQAREFAKDLKVSFSIQEVRRAGSIAVREVTMPFAMSPVYTRGRGGGYIVSDPSDPRHLEELCRQAATDLERWLRRYEAALIFAGGSASAMRKQLAYIESKIPQAEAA